MLSHNHPGGREPDLQGSVWPSWLTRTLTQACWVITQHLRHYTALAHCSMSRRALAEQYHKRRAAANL